MTETVLITKSGSIKTKKINFSKFDVNTELYKKCGFSTNKHFDKRHEWNVKINNTKFCVHLYAKNNGKATTENKYDFPPPVDNELYFGTCILINYFNGEPHNLTKEDWEKIYEKLFGGFEDLTKFNTDNDEEDELDNYSADMKTKSGYLKDGFVVESDDDDMSDGDNSDFIYNSDEETNYKNKNGSSKPAGDAHLLDDTDSESDNEDYITSDSDNSSELSEEPYYFSDED